MATKEKEVIASTGFNDSLDLKDFDYENLNGESFKKYLDIVNNLNGFEQRDFEQYMANGIFKKELDPSLTPRDVLIGIKINLIKPVNTTRVPVRIARDLNAQIMDRNNPESNSRYYLLKK